MFHDTLSLDRGSLLLTDEGYLHINAKVARTGIQTYAGHEVGRPDQETVAIYRDPAEVFAVDSLRSFASIPLTLDHPSAPVTAENWSELAKGSTGEEVLREGEYLKIGLRISDGDTIEAIQGGKRELSVGYGADLIWEAGTTEDGEAYDARQVDIRANHIAIVDRARAGSAARIGDVAAAEVATEVAEATDAGIKDQLIQDQADEIAQLKSDLARAQGERDAAQAQILDQETLEARVTARAALLADAKALTPHLNVSGLSDLAIRKAVCEARGLTLTDKAPEYVAARFDALKDALGDGLAQAPLQSPPKVSARSTYLDSLQTAWKEAF